MGGHRAHGRNDGQVQDAPHGGKHNLQSMGCNKTDYDNVEKLKRSGTDGFIGKCFKSFERSD